MLRNMVRLILTFGRMLLPWIFRFMRMAFFLTITCITSIYLGIPGAVNRIADNWLMEASAGGLPTGYHPGFRMVALAVAWISLVLGWLVLASLTVFVIRLFFFR